MKNCERCYSVIDVYDPDTRRWFEPSGRKHECATTPLYTDHDFKGELGFKARIRSDIIALNQTEIAVKMGWNPYRLRVSYSKDKEHLIIQPM